MLAITSELGDLGGVMSKRAKRGKTETPVLSVVGKVAVVVIAIAALGYGLLSHPASVQPMRKPSPRQVLLPPPSPPTPAPVRASVPAPASAAAPQVEIQKTADVPGRLVRQVVDYVSHEAPGTVVIDTGNTFLYLVLNPRQAMRYGIGVGREGFTWSGEQAVARKTEWPDWRPPADMLSRQPYLPRFMAGGLGNPLGARAMYLGETEYSIHGSNKPDTTPNVRGVSSLRSRNRCSDQLAPRFAADTLLRFAVFHASSCFW